MQGSTSKYNGGNTRTQARLSGSAMRKAGAVHPGGCSAVGRRRDAAPLVTLSLVHEGSYQWLDCGEHLADGYAHRAAGMFFQTLYFLVDLYFVSGLGITALAGVGAAGNIMLISHAVGRKDQQEANLIFNQALVFLRQFCGHRVVTRPSLALQFGLVAMGSALRGTGIVQPTIIVQIITVVANVVLAPVLIAGWITGHAMGVAGAGPRLILVARLQRVCHLRQR